MNITSVIMVNGQYKVETPSGFSFVPDDMKNRDRRKVQAWIDAGGVVTVQEPDPEPTEDEVKEAELSGRAWSALIKFLADELGKPVGQVRNEIKGRMQ